MTEHQKKLIDEVVARIATEVWVENKDKPGYRLSIEMYKIQDYLNAFTISEDGVEYPNGDMWKIDDKQKI